jgi:hypothetical protein
MSVDVRKGFAELVHRFVESEPDLPHIKLRIFVEIFSSLADQRVGRTGGRKHTRSYAGTSNEILTTIRARPISSLPYQALLSVVWFLNVHCVEIVAHILSAYAASPLAQARGGDKIWHSFGTFRRALKRRQRANLQRNQHW